MRIIAAFDSVRVEVWGPEHQRPNPAGTDSTYAKRWADAGLTADRLREEVFIPKMRAKHARGDGPPKGLDYFVKIVAERMTRPGNTGNAESDDPLDTITRFWTPDEFRWWMCCRVYARFGGEWPGRAFGFRPPTDTESQIPDKVRDLALQHLGKPELFTPRRH